MRRQGNGAQNVRIVAIGGGTGLPAILRGLKPVLFPDGADDPGRLVGIVAVSDDGGSSGRLRDELGLPAPGDLRNCLVALSHNEPLMARLFQARYRDGDTLSGHSVGNLILTALAQEENGNFLAAVRLASEVLNIQGRVYPSTLVPVTLIARLADGTVIRGESAIAARGGRVERVTLEPERLPAVPGTAESIGRADIVVLAPGSLYSSLLPNLLVPEIAQALRATRAFRVLVMNAMTEPGETSGHTAADHVRALFDHAGEGIVDGLVVATDTVPGETLARYRAEGADRLAVDPALRALVPLVVEREMLQVAPKVRHDPARTAQAVLDAHAAWRERRTTRTRVTRGGWGG